MFETQEISDNIKVFIKVPSIDDWTFTELRKCCNKHKVKGYTKMGRVQLIAAVKQILDNIKSR